MLTDVLNHFFHLHQITDMDKYGELFFCSPLHCFNKKFILNIKLETSRRQSAFGRNLYIHSSSLPAWPSSTVSRDLAVHFSIDKHIHFLWESAWPHRSVKSSNWWCGYFCSRHLPANLLAINFSVHRWSCYHTIRALREPYLLLQMSISFDLHPCQIFTAGMGMAVNHNRFIHESSTSVFLVFLWHAV